MVALVCLPPSGYLVSRAGLGSQKYWLNKITGDTSQSIIYLLSIVMRTVAFCYHIYHITAGSRGWGGKMETRGSLGLIISVCLCIPASVLS